MRTVVQRVTSASVAVADKIVGEIGRGFLALIGVARDDGEADVELIASKIAGLRIFDDAAGDMNLGLRDVDGAILAVSQFTLYGDARRGRRPSFIEAAPGEAARGIFDSVVARLRREGLTVATGEFGADMQVRLVNDGPVTILLDSKKTF